MRVGIDIGGTQTRIALIDKNKIEKLHIFKTSNSFFETFSKLQQYILEWKINEKIDLIAIGLPCPIKKGSKILGNINNLRDWQGVNIVGEFEKSTKIKTVINNDANYAALGQAIIKDKKNLLFFTISTGIGCGIIINGQIYEGFSGAAGEVANSMPITKNPKSDTSRNGIEFWASGKNIVLKLQEIGVNVTDAKRAFELYYQKNPSVVNFFEEIENKFVSFFSTMIYVLNPEIIVLGGSVAENNQEFFKEIFKRVLVVTQDIEYQTILEFAQDMTENTLIGAVNSLDE